MALADHLRELRNRIMLSGIAIILGAVVGWIYYARVLDGLIKPLTDLAAAREGVVNINFGGMTDPFATQITVSLFVGVILASPIWLMQIWGFIVPGLTKKEKRISLAFIASTIPLFAAGCWLGYSILPQSLALLYGLSPEGTSNIQQTSMYFSFVTRFILVFGLGFLFPVFLVALNVIGAMPAERLIKGWRVAVVLIFVFAAVATPTADPFTMVVFAAPLVFLYFAAWLVCRLLDKRKAASRPDWLDVDDTEASPI